MSILSKTKNLLLFLLYLLITEGSFGQSNVTYTKLTDLLPLIKNHQSNNFSIPVSDDPLQELILKLNWDLDNNETFEQLYREVKDLDIDYRYFLILSKMCNDSYRKPHVDNDDSFNNIDYYYKSLFLNLAIEKGTNLKSYHKDSLKYEYTKQYLLSTLNDYSFPDFNSFKDFAEINIKYCNELLNNLRFKLPKKERSELYWIIADANYRTKYVEEKDEKSLSTTLKYLSLAISVDPKNWRAIRDRADINKDKLENYNAAIKDYLLWLAVIENENKTRIAEHNKRLQKQKTNTKDTRLFMLTSPTFTRMADIAECYINLSDFKSTILWSDKGLIAMKEYRKYNKNLDEISSRYEGLLHFFRAMSYFNLKQKKLACTEIDLATNYGYDIEESRKLRKQIGCK